MDTDQGALAYLSILGLSAHLTWEEAASPGLVNALNRSQTAHPA